MASELTVQTIRGPLSGANANQILIPAGQTLVAPGQVIQVVSSKVDPGTLSTTSGTPIDTGLSATITPKLINSQILIFVCHFECYVGGASKAISFKLLKNGSEVGDFSGPTLGYSNSTANYFNVNMQFYESPNSLSPLTYKTQFYSRYGTGETVAVHTDNSTSYITIMEIAQ